VAVSYPGEVASVSFTGASHSRLLNPDLTMPLESTLRPSHVGNSNHDTGPGTNNLPSFQPFIVSTIVSGSALGSDFAEVSEGSNDQDIEDSTGPGMTGWNVMPPLSEVIEGCEVFIRSYFQLGFLAKTSFFERIQSRKEDISLFLLLGILSIAARFTPSLVKRYTNAQAATDHFLRHAEALVASHMYKPSLETIQGFFLTSLAEWGKGSKERSSIHMGIAIRMAGSMHLHREKTHALPHNATAEQIVESEVARRTFWVLENHDSLHAGHNAPVPFSLEDITTLLPCEEQEFAFGMVPLERAALAGTASAASNPTLTTSPTRSLFASLIQCHNIWGQISRRVSQKDIAQGQLMHIAMPEDTLSDSEHFRLSRLLDDFEFNLPTRHRWSTWNLRGFKAEGLDLAYLSVVTMTRLSDIVLHRCRLRRTSVVESHVPGAGLVSSSNNPRWDDPKTTRDLYSNMVTLYEQMEAFFALRSASQGFPAFVIYCLYIAGALANELRDSHDLRALDAGSLSQAAKIAESSTKLLTDLQHVWPMAKRWSKALLKRSTVQNGGQLSSVSNSRNSAVALSANPNAEAMMSGYEKSPEQNSSGRCEPQYDTCPNYTGVSQPIHGGGSVQQMNTFTWTGGQIDDSWDYINSDMAFNLWPSEMWQG
jgi:hypothetical protein